MSFVKEKSKMGSVELLAFTDKGQRLAETIKERLELENTHVNRVFGLKEFMPVVFHKGNVIVFVGAVGIAVRAIAPLIAHKTTDPAVLVVDELGKFVIPILSGHIGGANDFADKLARILGAVPVITTATDLNHVFSVDSFAVKNNYEIKNTEHIKTISGQLLNRHEVGLCTDFEILGDLPKNIILKQSGKVGIYISSKRDYPFEKTLHLMPKKFHFGIGARKNTEELDLEEFFLRTLIEYNIPMECVGSISSIDLKKDEKAILSLADKYHIQFITYSKDELGKYDSRFSQSDFVKSITGVGNVCETSAFLSSKMGNLVCKKKRLNGMTIAVFEEVWRVSFENQDARD